MTVSAIVKLYNDYSISITTTDYNVSIDWYATDGTNTFAASASAEIPFAWGARKADRFIRERTASAILANCSLTIDPEDIYIPLSS